MNDQLFTDKQPTIINRRDSSVCICVSDAWVHFKHFLGEHERLWWFTCLCQQTTKTEADVCESTERNENYQTVQVHDLLRLSLVSTDYVWSVHGQRKSVTNRIKSISTDRFFLLFWKYCSFIWIAACVRVKSSELPGRISCHIRPHFSNTHSKSDDLDMSIVIAFFCCSFSKARRWRSMR